MKNSNSFIMSRGRVGLIRGIDVIMLAIAEFLEKYAGEELDHIAYSNGLHLVCNHLGAIITGSFSTRSLMISKEALPEPTMIPALKVVTRIFPFLR